jgi:hypothetical protein
VQFSQTDGQAFLAARKLAAREYLKGLSAIEKVNAPEKIDPSPPSVPRLDISGPMTPEHEKLFDERDRLIKERETYMTNRRAIEVRTTLRNQIAYIYTRRPYFTAEIRELAAGSLRDPADLEGLMNQVSDAVQKRKAAVGGVELEMPPLPPEFSTVPASQATNSTKAPDAKGSPATSEPAAESR